VTQNNLNSPVSKGLPSKNSLKEAQSKYVPSAFLFNNSKKLLYKIKSFIILRAEGQVRAFHYMSMNAYSRHKKLCNDYIRYYGGGKSFSEVFKRDKLVEF